MEWWRSAKARVGQRRGPEELEAEPQHWEHGEDMRCRGECACVAYSCFWGSGADGEPVQEMGSSFGENHSHSFCSAGPYKALPRARPSPLMGTGPLPRLLPENVSLPI